MWFVGLLLRHQHSSHQLRALMQKHLIVQVDTGAARSSSSKVEVAILWRSLHLNETMCVIQDFLSVNLWELTRYLGKGTLPVTPLSLFARGC